MIKKAMASCLITLLITVSSFAQNAAIYHSNYDPHLLFSPKFYTTGSSITRAANGAPNTGYWQNKADYKITANLNDQTNEISGTVLITYKNNSPQSLPYLWLQLDQNLFNKDSRGQARMPLESRSRYGDSKSDFNGGYTINAVSISGYTGKVDYVISDTRMQVRLPKVLNPSGDVVTLKIDYKFTLPEYGADRCGIVQTKNGNIFTVAQWYPRMCVFDDVEGWNTLPYLGPSEFYLEYGDYDVYLTAPSSHIVVCSGELQNESEVLTAKQISRLAQARKSDATVMIRTETELNESVPNATRTWHYKMTNARDVAWAYAVSRGWLVRRRSRA
jgi:hypothetical protein